MGGIYRHFHWKTFSKKDNLIYLIFSNSPTAVVVGVELADPLLLLAGGDLDNSSDSSSSLVPAQPALPQPHPRPHPQARQAATWQIPSISPRAEEEEEEKGGGGGGGGGGAAAHHRAVQAQVEGQGNLLTVEEEEEEEGPPPPSVSRHRQVPPTCLIPIFSYTCDTRVFFFGQYFQISAGDN